MFFNKVPEIRFWQACFWGNYWMIGRETNYLALGPSYSH